MNNELPRRFFRSWGLITGAGIVLVLAVGFLFFVLRGRYEAFLPPALIASFLAGSYLILRRMWPKEIGIGTDGLRLRFRNRERFIAWADIYQVTVMPDSWKDDVWARIVYRDGHEETRALIIGRTAHAIAGEFQRLRREKSP